MTSWGCPFVCNFCSVTAMFGQLALDLGLDIVSVRHVAAGTVKLEKRYSSGVSFIHAPTPRSAVA